MSGIAGIFNLDSAPPDRALAETMADALAFRGPHGSHVWTGDSVAFVHTLLKTTYESESERQPASLDGQVWITADARIDAREDLARELGLPQSALSRPDCELILHAYARWGESCVDHLLGDFVFAIWDGRARKLFCARDHFGAKPFYYAHVGSTFVFSNTLNCIRIHGGVSDELNELAIADFLLFEYNQDLATTTFRDVRRLPPAHVLNATAEGLMTRRYWSLPDRERIRYRRTRDYVEHFRSLLEMATADRLRTKRVGVLMSGGLDSSSVAAFARRVRPETDLKAHTHFYERLMPDDEKHFASLVASALGIPIDFRVLDDARLFESTRDFATPEPISDPLWSYKVQYRGWIASDTPVILTGDGGDPLLTPSPLLTWAAVRSIPLGTTTLNIARYIWQFRSIPRVRLRSTLLTLLGRPTQQQFKMPRWINATFAGRLDLAAHVKEANSSSLELELRPLTRRSLRSPYWSTCFETEDPGCLGTPTERRRPYFDVRLVAYLLAIPELPFSIDKYLLRLALRGMVPEQVRRRPKTPLRGDPFLAAFQRFGVENRHPILHPRLHDFVNTIEYSLMPDEEVVGSLRTDLRVISLNLWLKFQEETWKRTQIRRPSILSSELSTPRLNCASMATPSH